jgi:cell division protein FtsQ
MHKMIISISLFVLTVILGVVMHQRNQKRAVTLQYVSWEDDRPIWMSKDSVNKLLTLALSDSVSAFKSGLNLRNIEQTLNQNAWVEDAQSYVSVDGGVGVHVTTKIPIVRIQSDSSYYVDNRGEPFPLSAFKSVQVPFVYGNPTLEQRHALVDVVRQMSKDSFMSDHIVAYEWISEGLIVEPRHQEYSIVLGTPDQLHEKIKNYKAFYAKMQDSTVLKTYKTVNLSFHGQVVCSK